MKLFTSKSFYDEVSIEIIKKELHNFIKKSDYFIVLQKDKKNFIQCSIFKDQFEIQYSSNGKLKKSKQKFNYSHIFESFKSYLFQGDYYLNEIKWKELEKKQYDDRFELSFIVLICVILLMHYFEKFILTNLFNNNTFNLIKNLVGVLTLINIVLIKVKGGILLNRFVEDYDIEDKTTKFKIANVIDYILLSIILLVFYIYISR